MQLDKALSSLIWLQSWPLFEQLIGLDNACCLPIQNFIWSCDKNMIETQEEVHISIRVESCPQMENGDSSEQRYSECCCPVTVRGRERAADDDWTLWDTYRHLNDQHKAIFWKLIARNIPKIWVDKTVLNKEWWRLNTCFLESSYQTIWHDFIRDPWAGVFEDDLLLQKETQYL